MLKKFILKLITPKRALFYISIYLIFGLLLYIFQRNFLYMPTKPVWDKFDSFILQNQGEEIEIITVNEGKKKALIYFGGNAEAVIYNAHDFISTLPAYTIYLFNYRGFSNSSGNPSEAAIYSDALTLYDHIVKTHDSISIIGRSLGSGVATYVAANKNVDKLALITPFDSIENIAQDKFFIYPMNILLQDKYDSISRVSQISAKTLVIIAGRDQVIPKKSSDNLIATFPTNQISEIIIESADHNNISAKAEYATSLNNFFER